jgi:hypothetical protein
MWSPRSGKDRSKSSLPTNEQEPERKLSVEEINRKLTSRKSRRSMKKESQPGKIVLETSNSLNSNSSVSTPSNSSPFTR